MSVEKVKRYFKQWNMEDKVLEFPVSSATVADAALALGTEEKRIAKTMSFMLEDRAILIVTAGDARIDNKKYKSYFHKKAAMLKHDEVESLIGHPVGGVCPFGLENPLSVYCDITLKQYAEVLPAAGAIHSAVRISPDRMAELTAAKWVDVCI